MTPKILERATLVQESNSFPEISLEYQTVFKSIWNFFEACYQKAGNTAHSPYDIWIRD